MKRLKDTSLVIDFEGMNLPRSGLMKLGGEGKQAYYSTIYTFEIKAPEMKGNSFKLYLSTPAMFKNGWLPEWIDEATLKGEREGLKLKLTAASIGRVDHIGGFDIKAGEPKPMRQAVPAGSVYHFEILNNGKTVSPINIFHGKALSDFDKEQGFELPMWEHSAKIITTVGRSLFDTIESITMLLIFIMMSLGQANQRMEEC